MSAELLHCPHLPTTVTPVRSPGQQGHYSMLFPTAALQQAFSFSEALHSGSEEEVMPQSSAVKRFFQDNWIQCRPGLWVTESAYPSPSNAVELHGSPGNSLHRAFLEFPNTSDSERAWGSGSVRGPWPKALLTWEQNREAWRLVLPHPTGK